MADRRRAGAWALGAAAGLLLVASLTGSGLGPWGFVLFGHMAWSYALVAAAFALAFFLARPREAEA
jgi:FtsH-binding integral membrane protein